jgi:ribosomal protein L37E
MDDKNRKCANCGSLDVLPDRDQCAACKWESSKKSAAKSITHYLRERVNIARHRAKKKGWDFEFTIEEAMEIWRNQNGECAVTGFPMTHSMENFEFSASIDRMDNSLGYTKGNVRLVCARVNMMRNTLDAEMFLFWAKAVSKNNEA